MKRTTTPGLTDPYGGLNGVVEHLKSTRTDRGDLITLLIELNKNTKPNVSLKFDTKYPELKVHPKVEDITDWIPDSLEELNGDIVYTSWKSYIEDYLIGNIRSIVSTGGRDYTFNVSQANVLKPQLVRIEEDEIDKSTPDTDTKINNHQSRGKKGTAPHHTNEEPV